MRSVVADYDVLRVAKLKDALARRAAEPGVWTPLAGGTDLMVLFEGGQLTQRRILSLWGLAELHGITADAKQVTLGALTTYSEIKRHPLLSQEFPLLGQAAGLTGGLAIQNRGTVGGNLANASPAADTPPALLAYDAEVVLASTGGERTVPLSSFYLGYKRLALRPDELIVSVRLPRPCVRRAQLYQKVGTRRAQAISKVVLAATLEQPAGGALGAVRLAIGSVAPTPLRLLRTEAVLSGQRLTPALIDTAVATLTGEIAPIDDIRSTADYRQAVAGNLLRRLLTGAP